MRRILAFTSGPNDWRTLLARPKCQWRSGFSARTLAFCWEAADGFPPEISDVLMCNADPLIADLVPILAVPEFKVPLPGGARESQNDIFILARSSSGPVSIMVEGKVKESFGPLLGEWTRDASAGKRKRLKYLVETLGLEATPDDSIRYQLLHRAASAILEGQRYRAVAAVFLVHSFCSDRTGCPDYEAFLRLFGVQATVAEVQRLPSTSTMPLFAAWVPGDLSFLEC